MSVFTNLCVAIPLELFNESLMCRRVFDGLKPNKYLIDLLNSFEEEEDVDAMMLFNTTFLPSYIEYDLTKSFRSLIPQDYLHSICTALSRGYLLKCSREDEEETTEVIYELYQTTTKLEESYIVSLFVQSCQLIDPNTKLLLIVAAWLKKEVITNAVLSNFEKRKTKKIDQNVSRNSCCFKRVIVFKRRGSSDYALGILEHSNCTNVKQIKDVVKIWYT